MQYRKVLVDSRYKVIVLAYNALTGLGPKFKVLVVCQDNYSKTKLLPYFCALPHEGHSWRKSMGCSQLSLTQSRALEINVPTLAKSINFSGSALGRTSIKDHLVRLLSTFLSV